MAAKLKVFTWSDGFHAFTVAASSRPKALEAWGATQNLFKSGLAHEVEDGADRDAALASPGAVISRRLSMDVDQATIRKVKSKDEKAKARVRALEAELQTLDAEQAEAVQALDRRQAKLDRERQGLEVEQEKARKAVLSKLDAARVAGG